MPFRRPRPGHPFFGGAPLLIAHRGGAALAPENTMAAFELAVNRWDADILEMDVRLTADGMVVVIHDQTVDRTTSGTGPIGEMTWRQARELDAGWAVLCPPGEDHGVVNTSAGRLVVLVFMAPHP